MGHLPWKELERRQEEVAVRVPVGSVWEHFRTREHYQVIGHCVIEATDEGGILYKCLAHPIVTLPRSYAEWTELMEHEGETVPRFREV
jgi:hypothetical protein